MKTGTCKKTRSLWETFLCQDLQKVKCEAKGSFVKIAILLALKACLQLDTKERLSLLNYVKVSQFCSVTCPFAIIAMGRHHIHPSH